LFYFKFLILVHYYFLMFRIFLFKLKNIFTCFSSLIFYINILHHGTCFDPKTSLVRNITLTINIHQALKCKVYILHLLHTQNQRKNCLKNSTVEQHNYPLGYILMPIKGANKQLFKLSTRRDFTFLKFWYLKNNIIFFELEKVLQYLISRLI